MPGPNLPPLIVLTSGPSPPPPPSRRPSSARYGLLYPLGVAGLVLLIGWIGWFGYRAWTMRDIWRAVAIVHDPARSIDDRLASARLLAADPRVTEDQLEPMVFESTLPMRLRIVLAGGLARPSILQQRFPRRLDRYPMLPMAIQLTMLMKLAEAAEPGAPWPMTPLERMGVPGGDESVRVLSLYCRSAAFGSAQAAMELQEAADADPSGEGLASILSSALQHDDQNRAEALDRAAQWLHRNHRAFLKMDDPGPG